MTAVTGRPVQPADGRVIDHFRCRGCGKRGYHSAEDAAEAARRAVVDRVLRDQRRRTEARWYECTANAGAWHLTSLRQPLGEPAELRYAVDDDATARVFLEQALRNPLEKQWTARLFADEARTEQTVRILGDILRELMATGAAYRAAEVAAHERYHVADGTIAEIRSAAAARVEWSASVALYRAQAEGRITQGKAALRQHRIERDQAVKAETARRRADDQAEARAARAAERAAQPVGDEERVRLRAAIDRAAEDSQMHRRLVQTLARAVAEHRAATAAPTAADDTLHALLDTLTAPHQGGHSTLAELLDGIWHPDRDTARAAVRAERAERRAAGAVPGDVGAEDAGEEDR